MIPAAFLELVWGIGCVVVYSKEEETNDAMKSYEAIRMKRKLASFVVDHRRAVFVLMLLIAAVSAFLLTKVEINEDLTKYLPDKSAMKQGIDIMAAEFPEAQTSQTVRVMFDHLQPEEKIRM